MNSGGGLMDSAKLWSRIIERATIQAFEIHTVPQSNRKPLWFRISSDGSSLFVSQAKDHTPSSTLKMPRTITFQEFNRIFPYYELRLQGTSVSKEAGQKSVNTVYIYGLIADVLDKTAVEA
jgi:hypothetical protein